MLRATPLSYGGCPTLSTSVKIDAGAYSCLIQGRHAAFDRQMCRPMQAVLVTQTVAGNNLAVAGGDCC